MPPGRSGGRLSPPNREVPKEAVLRRIDRDWVVFDSVENEQHDRCTDLFRRQDGSWGFEEFRRDVEDQGRWTPVAFHSGAAYPSREAAWASALGKVAWLAAERRD